MGARRRVTGPNKYRSKETTHLNISAKADEIAENNDNPKFLWFFVYTRLG